MLEAPIISHQYVGNIRLYTHTIVFNVIHFLSNSWWGGTHWYSSFPTLREGKELRYISFLRMQCERRLLLQCQIDLWIMIGILTTRYPPFEVMCVHINFCFLRYLETEWTDFYEFALDAAFLNLELNRILIQSVQ